MVVLINVHRVVFAAITESDIDLQKDELQQVWRVGGDGDSGSKMFSGDLFYLR